MDASVTRFVPIWIAQGFVVAREMRAPVLISRQIQHNLTTNLAQTRQFVIRGM